MIQVVQGFRVSTRDAVDNRLLLTKAEMRTVKDTQMPEKYFTICKDDGMLYLYDKSATAGAETGKFTQFSSSKIESISVNGQVLPIDTNKNVDLPLATAERLGLVKLGLGFEIGSNDEIVFNFNALPDGTIPASKINWENTVIDGSNIPIM